MRRCGSAAVRQYIPAVPPNILIVRFSSIGDLLLTTPLLRALRVRHPQAQITFVTKASYAPLIDQNPRLNRVIGWRPERGLRALVGEVREVGGVAGFTHRLDLQDNFRSRAFRWMVGGRWTTYPKHRVARTALIRWKRDWYSDRRPVAEQYFDAARGLDVGPDAGSLEIFLPGPATVAAEQFLRGAAHGHWAKHGGLGLSRQLIALAPGTAHLTKRWPAHHWVALARRLGEQGNDVVVLGGVMDQAAGEEIVRSVRSGGAAMAGGAASAAGLDLATTAALLMRCRALVAGDTGQMHLATAVGTPVIALFGPTVEAFGFTPYHAKAAVLQRDLPCRPCSSHGGPACPLKHHRCMQDIQPGDVLAALRKLPR